MTNITALVTNGAIEKEVSLPMSCCEIYDLLEEFGLEEESEIEVLSVDTGFYHDDLDLDFVALDTLAGEIDWLEDYELAKLDAILEAVTSDLVCAMDYMNSYEFVEGVTLEEYAYDLANEMDLPEFAKRYFDYEAFARDLGYDGYTETDNGVLYC